MVAMKSLFQVILLGSSFIVDSGESFVYTSFRSEREWKTSCLATSSRELKERGKKRQKKRTSKDVLAALESFTRDHPVDIKLQSSSQVVENDVGTLSHLTEAIDARLRDRMNPSTYFVDGIVKQVKDSMDVLLEFNEREHRESLHEIVVIFGKHLIDDQITVEYSSRINKLVSLLKGEKLNPDLICFCGDVHKGNHISDADAGFIYFKNMCSKEGISLENIKFFLDRSSNTEGKALQHVAIHLIKEHIVEWLAISHQIESSKDEYGLERKNPRKKMDIHFTLISNDYHLCHINDVHRRSPNQSPLRPIEMLCTSDRTHAKIGSEYDDEFFVFQGTGRSRKGSDVVNGIIDCSWSYVYATYPFLYTKDRASAFMGRCYVLGEELKPLLINIKGVLAEREFLQRDNFMAAAAVRHKLVSQLEDLYKNSPSLRLGLREVANFSNSKETIDVVLEGATLSLGRCIDLVRPAGLHQSSVLKTEYVKALKCLSHCMTQIQVFCDPDQPLDTALDRKIEFQDSQFLDGDGI